MTISAFAAGICVSSGGIHALSVALALPRCARRKRKRTPVPENAPSVTIVQPLCGVEIFTRETLRSIFALDYPDYEIIFCLADADDPIAPLVRGAIASHPERPARLLIGDDRVSANPKLNNVVKGWKAARHEWVIIADSNVLMPPDYIQRLLERWRPNSGIVCAPPIGSQPESFAAEIECAFLNTYEARWQYAAEAVGLGFAQGKTMLWRRDILEAGGGIRALGAEVAEDAATTKMVRAQGRKPQVMDSPFTQPLGPRSVRQVVGRQVRWARLRRLTFPAMFAPEILTGSFLPLLAGLYFAAAEGLNLGLVAGLLLAIWCGAEAMMARCAGWHFSWRMPLAIVIRDLLLPLMWVDAWLNNEVVWRGSTVSEPRTREMRLKRLTEAPAYVAVRRLTSRRRRL